MSDEFFVDTDILVYAFDASEKRKRVIAKKIVANITAGQQKGVVSNQVLGELFVALTKKIENPVSTANARIIINGLIDSVHWKKINYSTRTVSNAIETTLDAPTHFWDALIVETMLENKVHMLLTENTKHFKSPFIRVKNPFKSH